MSINGLVVDESGLNNQINVEVGTKFEKSNIFINGNNNKVILGSALIYKNLKLKLKGNNKTIQIKPSDKKIENFKWVTIRGNNQTLCIGRNLCVGGLEIQMNDGNEHCSIGDDCLLSWNIKIRTSDGHSVVDLATDKAINLPKSVIISDRVWVGEGVSFLKGSKVSADSVVGSHAIVTKKFEQPNCVIAGFPAKVVKENIKWDRRMPTEYNDKCNS